MWAKTTRAKSRKAAGQCVEPLDGYAAAMPGLHERAMDRQRDGALCRPPPAMRGDIPDLWRRPTEVQSALPLGGTGG